MTQCSQFKDNMLLFYYGELSSPQADRMQRHLSICRECSMEYKKLTTALDQAKQRTRPALNEEYWEGYWDRLAEKINSESASSAETPRKIHFLTPLFSRNVLLRTAAALILVVLGGLAGRFLFPPGQQAVLQKKRVSLASRSSAVRTAFTSHLNQLQPLLVDCRQAYASNSQTVIPLPRTVLESLLTQNQLLKQIVEKSGDMRAKKILEDIELVLLELVFGAENNTQRFYRAGHLLEKENLMFRVNVMRNRKTADI